MREALQDAVGEHAAKMISLLVVALHAAHTAGRPSDAVAVRESRLQDALRKAITSALHGVIVALFDKALPKLLTEAFPPNLTQGGKLPTPDSIDAADVVVGKGDGEVDGEPTGDDDGDGEGVDGALRAGERDGAAAAQQLRVLATELLESVAQSLRPAVTQKAEALIEPTATLMAQQAEPLLRGMPWVRARSEAAFQKGVTVTPAPADEEEDVEAGLISAEQRVESVVAQVRPLLGQLANACDGGFEGLVKATLLGRAKSLGSGVEQVARPFRRVAACMEAYEQRVAAKADKGKALYAKYVPKGSLRSMLIERTLTVASKYQVSVGGVSGSLSMLKQVVRRTRVELTKDENELTYLKERLTIVEEKETNEMSWRDTAESWKALIKLRGQIGAERGQAILECIVNEDKVLEGLGAALQLQEIAGAPPSAVINLLNDGPGAHIRQNAYRYLHQVDQEVAIIRRVRELQVRLVALMGSAFVALMVGLFNLLADIIYAFISCGRYSCSST